MINNTTIANLSIVLHSNDPAAIGMQKLFHLIKTGLVSGFAVGLNLVVVISSGFLLKKHQEPKATYLFMGNLAMADLVYSLVAIFGPMYPVEYRNHYICAVIMGFMVLPSATSVYTIGLIAVDRFLYINYGLQYQKWVYPTRAYLLIVFTWLIGFMIGFMPIFGWSSVTDNGRNCIHSILSPKHQILLRIFLFMIPLLIVLVLYSIILHHAISTIAQLPRATEHQPNPNFRGPLTVDDDASIVPTASIFKSNATTPPSRWKALKVTLFTTLWFVATWLPLLVARSVYAYQCEGEHIIIASNARCQTFSSHILSNLLVLAFANSLINPIIYTWWHNVFRRFVRERCCARSIDPLASTTRRMTLSTIIGDETLEETRNLALVVFDDVGEVATHM